MKRWLVACGLVIVAVAVAVMVLPASGGADDGSNYVVTCGPNPYPDPQAEDDCLPTTPNLTWVDGKIRVTVDSNGDGQPDGGTCDIEPDDPNLVSGYHQVHAFTDVSCDNAQMINGKLSVKLFWTTCRRQYDDPPTHCDLNTSSLPMNPAYDSCQVCTYLAANAVMNGRRYYTRYYWAHTIARSDNIYPKIVSYWTPPKAIYVP